MHVLQPMRRQEVAPADGATSCSVRFLLTFDDGPDPSPSDNRTVRVLDQLKANAVQRDVKVIFFVQTRNPGGGGSAYGRAILRREHAEGHVLGLHSGTTRGHVSHVWMSARELEQSLKDGMEDLRSLTGQDPALVRPPYWWFTPGTLSQYGRHGLHMVLSDIKAHDGVNWGMHVFRRPNLRLQLAAVRGHLTGNQCPLVDGRAPVIVTFHDTNDFTAKNLEEYLRILIEEAREVGVPVDEKPFYDDPRDIMTVALQRAVAVTRSEVQVRAPLMSE